MPRITDVSHDEGSVTVTVEGVAVVGPNEYPWRLTLEAPRELYFKADGSMRPRPDILQLLKTYVFSELV